MSAMVLALGELEHIYNKQNLKLRTSGSVFLLPLRAPDIISAGCAQDLEALVSSETWVAGGNRLRICFYISFDDIIVSVSDTSNLIEKLGLALCNTEIWSQLNLQASLSLPEDDNDRSRSSGSIILSLTSRPSSQAHVKPPKRIPAAHLEAINLTLNFSACRRIRVSPKEQRQSIQSESFGIAQAKDAEIHCKKMDQRWNLQSSRQGLPFVTSQREGGALVALPTGKMVPSMDETVDQTVLSQDRVTTVPSSNPRESILSSARLVSVIDGPRSSHRDNSQSRFATHQVEFGDTLKMVNASLHTILYGRLPSSRGQSGGVIVSSDEGFPKLATLSPALFNPGYAQAISDRKDFHFTIAHTMTGVYCRTKSTTLKRRLDRLLNLAPDTYLGEDPIPFLSSELSRSTLTDAINARLWSLTKSKIFDLLASRRLKLMDTSRQASDEGIMSSSMLVDVLAGDGADQSLFATLNGDPSSIDSQHIFVERKVAYSGNLFEDLDDLEADNPNGLLEVFSTFDEDNVALIDGQDGELLLESEWSLTEEDIGHACITEAQHSDDGMLGESQCLASQYPLENHLVNDRYKVPYFGSRNDDLLLESQHGFVNEGQDDWSSDPDNSQIMETEDMGNDMLLDGSSLAEEIVADEDVFWKSQHVEEGIPGESLGQCKSMPAWDDLGGYSHESLDVGAKKIPKGGHEFLNEEI